MRETGLLTSKDGKEALALKLLEEGANIEAKDNEGYTPLHNAVLFGNEDRVLTLIARGANIEAKDDDGNTPLHLAVLFGNEDRVLTLIARGANIEAKDYDGNTPLHLAVLFGNEDRVLTLIEKGANIEAKDYDGNTPLLLAAQDDKEALALMLIEKNASPDIVSALSITPLYLAAERGQITLVKAMLLKSDSLLNQFSALKIAYKSSHVDIATEILRHAPTELAEQGLNMLKAIDQHFTFPGAAASIIPGLPEGDSEIRRLITPGDDKEALASSEFFDSIKCFIRLLVNAVSTFHQCMTR
jgi:ankyrin repeat protein